MITYKNLPHLQTLVLLGQGFINIPPRPPKKTKTKNPTLDEAIATNVIATQYLKFFLKKLSKNIATRLTLTKGGYLNSILRLAKIYIMKLTFTLPLFQCHPNQSIRLICHEQRDIQHIIVQFQIVQ